MSQASEWARRHAQTAAVQPKFECVTWNVYADPDEKDVTSVQVVGRVHETGRLHMPGAIISPSDACAYARWILDVFGNAAEFPAERSGARP